ncbi:MAG TPA: D-alanyl-D-alanine endopeptidase [Rhodocyclaceae bacterium]|nr:D-alanyl-D-alanine endopeptidase [Rhodocyclaceae bacterium]HMZ75614.1 D-alanyl-D-alanine endopeptidase [Rhodocyclaceae bacterium]HNB64174.1 D-alanyl-D-alanine endopeptidase [Rhodocyclaceae bacterium]HND23666.1 D-alanyl-D-alanine endopeptidase [Rhodocyclaceae bacterium]HNI82324.1 D-alanyl-D-alanine endopeptidase [Rhodocyclaceae bacterium]
MNIRKSLLALAGAVALQATGPADALAATHRPAKKSFVAKAAPAPAKNAKARNRAAARAAFASPQVQRTAALAVAPEMDHEGNPVLASAAFMVADQATGTVLLEKNSDAVLPIASITKLMTAMVVLDARLNLGEVLTVANDDVDTLRGSSSHLPVGVDLTREDMLRLALMSSENRAASALARHYPGGLPAFVAAMNRKAVSLGLKDTRFSDSTGLNSANVSSARDLVKMVSAASRYPLIREFSTTGNYTVYLNGRPRQFGNTNALVKSPDWQIGVSKTGFINESGKCLVMQAWLLNKPMIIVLLDSFGRFTRVADAQRVKRWLESAAAQQRLAEVVRGGPTT